MNYSLNQIEDGPLGVARASHLLNRALFGPRRQEIEQFSNLSITQAIDQLLSTEPAPGPPLQVFGEDPNVPFGTTWVESVPDGAVRFLRKKSLRSWWMGLCVNQESSLREKMVMFWHNHFVTETNVVSIPAYLYQYLRLIRERAIGNFKELAADMTVNTAMLRYLDGTDNTEKSPNENYARELFELFTIGKGPRIGDGNYTYYTEHDVQEAARVLTGWKINGNTLSSYYKDSVHDKGDKVFSEYYGAQQISNAGEEEYKELISMIFAKKQTAIYLVQKIYRWFVYYHISEEVMKNIILPLADLLYENDYEMQPMLRTLLGSQHFFDAGLRGAYIKSPMEIVAGSVRRLELDLSQDLSTQYEFWNLLYLRAYNQEMDLGTPPDVAGWPAYYLEPQFNRLWINAATLPQRAEFVTRIITTGYSKNGTKMVADKIGLAQLTSLPSSATTLITELGQLLLPVPLSEAQIADLMEVLIPGLPEFEWTVEWNAFIANPDNNENRTAVEKSLSDLLIAMTSLPEYQLI